MTAPTEQPTPRTGPVRNLTVLTRKEGTTPEQFREHWLEVHAPLARRALPHALRYVQNHVMSSGTRVGYPTHDYEIDGIVEFVFESREGMAEDFASPLGQELMEDATRFIGRMRVYEVVGHVIVDCGTVALPPPDAAS